MAYKLLGVVVWKMGKSLLRYRSRGVMPPKPLLAGGAALVVAGGALLAARRLRGKD